MPTEPFVSRDLKKKASEKGLLVVSRADQAYYLFSKFRNHTDQEKREEQAAIKQFKEENCLGPDILVISIKHVLKK